jgi:hypothetical protein
MTRDIAAGVAIGTAGGFLCWLAGLPAPWLAGSMIAGVIAIFSGATLGMPDWLRALSFIFLGIQTGTSVTPATVESAVHWPISIAFLGVTVMAVTWAGTWYYTKYGKWDGATALFASVPGALSLVLLLASTTKADMRRVTIAQCIRLFFLVAALPAVITWLSPPEAILDGQAVIANIADVAIIVAVSAAAGYGLEWLKMPAGLMLGPMLASAALELSGVVTGAAPNSILIPANIVLGVMIASRFQAFTFAEFRGILREGFTGFLIALTIALACAGIASAAADLPFALALLAFAPGGLDAMTILAFALNLDPAYVGAHQMARYLGLAFLMPVATGHVLARMGVAAGHGNVTSNPRSSRLEDI